jgi:hypothetical protein
VIFGPSLVCPKAWKTGNDKERAALLFLKGEEGLIFYRDLLNSIVNKSKGLPSIHDPLPEKYEKNKKI